MKIAEITEIAEIASRTKPLTCDNRFPPSLYYSFLYLLARQKRPLQLSVELGVCGGGGSYHLAKGWELGRVVGYDKVLEYPDNVAFIQEHCSNFTFFRGDSLDTSPVKVLGKKVDILFIDTIHTYDRTMAEFNAWRPMMNDGGIVCLDDLHRDGMDRAWAEMPELKARLDFLHIGGSPSDGGFGVVLL